MSTPPTEMPNARRFLKPGIFVGLLFFLLWLRLPARDGAHPKLPDGARAHTGQAFGTSFSIRWMGAVPEDQVATVVGRVVDEVNAAMSTYLPDSEISRFNRSTSTRTVTVSEGFRVVLAEAYRVHNETGGAFDPSVGPLVDAWGFGPSEVVQPPSEQALRDARARVGLGQIEFDPLGRLRKTSPRLSIDLSAIAKGFAVDEVSRGLHNLGAGDHLVEIGGEVRARGEGPKGRWRVGIERPIASGQREVIEVVHLHDGALATSGHYRNFVTVEGKTLTHIIDPRSGEPVDHGLGSVTVVHSECVTADALATALYVLGEEEGLIYAKANEIAALFLTEVDGELRRKASPAFLALEDPSSFQHTPKKGS